MRFALPCGELLRARGTAARFAPHLHGTYSVVILRAGSADIWSHRWSGTVQAGDVFFFNPFEVHAGVSARGTAEYDVLYPSRVFVETCAPVDAREGCLTIRTAVSSQTPQTRALAEALAEARTDGEATEILLRQVLTTCTYAVAPATSQGVAHVARSIIGERCGRAIRTEDLAEEVGVHRSHLIRSFSAAVGLAPQAYMRQVRIAGAPNLIRAGLTLSEAAQALGFCDQAHLSREFKKVFGVPPGALSRDIGSAEASNPSERRRRGRLS